MNLSCFSPRRSGFIATCSMARAMKEQKPDIKICFVGPHVQIKPAESLLASPDIDFVVRGEFDHAGGRVRAGQTAFRNRERQLRERRQNRPQPVAAAAADRRAGRAALCHRRLPEEI